MENARLRKQVALCCISGTLALSFQQVLSQVLSVNKYFFRNSSYYINYVVNQKHKNFFAREVDMEMQMDRAKKGKMGSSNSAQPTHTSRLLSAYFLLGFSSLAGPTCARFLNC